MSKPILLCQGFQNAFVDADGRLFSRSAAARRQACLQLLRHARISGWTVLHAFLEGDAIGSAGQQTIGGFEPTASECYFRQHSLSAFRGTTLEAKAEASPDNPIFLISMAGLAVIAATLSDATERRLPLYVVEDGIADVEYGGVPEVKRLDAISTLARVHGRLVRVTDVVLFRSGPRAFAPIMIQSTPPSSDSPGDATDLEALEMMARYLAEELKRLMDGDDCVNATARQLWEELAKIQQVRRASGGKHRTTKRS